MAYVYMVRCCDGSFYTGYAENVQQRVLVHNQGRGAKYTRTRRPVQLVYWTEAESRSAALKEEARLKKLTHAQKEQLCREYPPKEFQ
jgi:putative endonuclease